jgi:hypothetical protein
MVQISTVRTGMIGETAVVHDITKNYDFNIYTTVCDDRGCDLVVERRKKDFVRVQVKTITSVNRNTSVEVRLKKYINKDLIDIVAVYYQPKDIIAYIPYDNQTSINLALKGAKNKQKKFRHYFYQYMEFPVE